jgi:O-antigen ligase
MISHFTSLLFFPIVIGLALGSRNPFGKLFYFSAAFLVLAGTVVTFSRGGFLGLIFVLGTLAWRLGRIRRGLAVIVTILLLSFFLLLAPGAYRQRLATTRDDSAQARTAELKRSIYLAVRHPLLGIGIGNYVLYSDTEHATHNSYTQWLPKIGLPAAIVYVLFLMAATKRARRVPHPKDIEKKDRWLPYLAIGLQASMIGYMVTSFFASVAYLWYLYYIAAYIICVDRLYQTSLNAQKVTKDQHMTPFNESVYFQNNVAPKLG